MTEDLEAYKNFCERLKEELCDCVAAMKYKDDHIKALQKLYDDDIKAYKRKEQFWQGTNDKLKKKIEDLKQCLED